MMVCFPFVHGNVTVCISLAISSDNSTVWRNSAFLLVSSTFSTFIATKLVGAFGLGSSRPSPTNSVPTPKLTACKPCILPLELLNLIALLSGIECFMLLRTLFAYDSLFFLCSVKMSRLAFSPMLMAVRGSVSSKAEMSGPMLLPLVSVRYSNIDCAANRDAISSNSKPG